jgi:3-isopropylmalate/(R)-2-methylmalate dehydratase small subunit
METKVTGKIIVVGDNIDTDQIYPGRYLDIVDPKEIGSHCLCGVDESIAANFPQGGMVVAGRNFGCGSSREHAPIALLNMGAKAVLADSFARIFFRNAINLGLLPIICKGIREKVKDGMTLTLDLEKYQVTVQETGETYPCEKLGDQALKILEAGGIKPLMRQRFAKIKAEVGDK